MSQCKAITKKGTRCKNSAGDDGYCWIEDHKPKLSSVQLGQDDNYRVPPEYLNKVGKKYWMRYLKNLKNTDFTEYAKLGDLCYWEQRKKEAIENLEKSKDVFVYRNKDGSVKHVQPSAFFTNLRNIQSEINTLRDKLFPKAEAGIIGGSGTGPLPYQSKKAKDF